MHHLVRLGVAWALTLPLTSTSIAGPLRGSIPGPGPGQSCAPDGLRPPSLSLLRGGRGDGLLRLQADPGLAGGGAVLLLEDPHGPLLPRGLCVSGLRGHLMAVHALDGDGRTSWEVPAAAAGAAASLRALAWPAGGTWLETHVSGSIQLPMHPGYPTLGIERVLVSEFQKDPTTVSDAKGEWIEVHNAGSAPVDLEGWTLADLGTDQTVLDAGGAGIVVPPGGYVVLGREADPALNGGVAVDAVYTGVTLSNGDDEIVLIRPDGWVADQLEYDDGVAWPDEAGRSASLRPDRLDPDLNDDGALWCSSTSPIGGGPDTGTPGAKNDPCGG